MIIKDFFFRLTMMLGTKDSIIFYLYGIVINASIVTLQVAAQFCAIISAPFKALTFRTRTPPICIANGTLKHRPVTGSKCESMSSISSRHFTQLNARLILSRYDSLTRSHWQDSLLRIFIRVKLSWEFSLSELKLR